MEFWKTLKWIDKSKTIHADLNGDNKKETIRFKLCNYDGTYYNKLRIYINGKRSYTLTDGVYGGFYDAQYRFVKIKGKKFLYIGTYTDSDWGTEQLFQYKNKKLKRVILFNSGRSLHIVEDLKVKGRELRVKMFCAGDKGIGLYRYRGVYTYKNGRFKLKSNTYRIIGEYWITDKSGEQKSTRRLTVAHKFNIYSTRTGKKKIGTVPAGTVVKMTKVYFHGSCEKGYSSYYITGGGYSGWYCTKDYKYFDYNNGDLFKGFHGVS